MDRAKLFATLRRRDSGVFGTSLSQPQVDGINGILDAFASHGDRRKKTLAYALATVYHETGRRMVPVREGFARDDAGARRIVAKRAYGKPAGKYGHVYYGRGQVQITWIENYERSSLDAGYDLVAYPDKMLDPVISARVLVKGLIDGRWNGKGRGIAHYLPSDGPDDLKNARRTVNITDKWELIAGYYQAFLAAIEAAGGVPVADPKPPAPVPAPVDAAKPPQLSAPKPNVIDQKTGKSDWLTALINAILAAWKGNKA
ncbi:glycoside hydrolase family 19 protein [Rhizobium arsenicireducens]